MTLSLLLALARQIPQACASLKSGEWDRKRFVGSEICGKTIGIVGLGRIGREVAARCRAFGMTVVGFDPVLAPDVAREENIELMSLTELYPRCDFITLHTPLTPEMAGLINSESLEMCKRGVCIINCAQGGGSSTSLTCWRQCRVDKLEGLPLMFSAPSHPHSHRPLRSSLPTLP